MNELASELEDDDDFDYSDELAEEGATGEPGVGQGTKPIDPQAESEMCAEDAEYVSWWNLTNPAFESLAGSWLPRILVHLKQVRKHYSDDIQGEAADTVIMELRKGAYNPDKKHLRLFLYHIAPQRADRIKKRNEKGKEKDPNATKAIKKDPKKARKARWLSQLLWWIGAGGDLRGKSAEDIPDPTAEAAVQTADDTDLFNYVLTGESLEIRVIVWLLYFHALSLSEVSTILGRSIASTKALWFRSRKSIRTRIIESKLRENHPVLRKFIKH